MHLGADMMRDEADDPLSVGRRQPLPRVRESLGQAVHPKPPIRVQHHLDDGGIFQPRCDPRPERRAQHARAT